MPTMSAPRAGPSRLPPPPPRRARPRRERQRVDAPDVDPESRADFTVRGDGDDHPAQPGAADRQRGEAPRGPGADARSAPRGRPAPPPATAAAARGARYMRGADLPAFRRSRTSDVPA